MYSRNWAAEHAAQIRLYKEIGKDLKKLLAWLKKEYRKEFLLSFIITIAFTGKGYALAPTMSVKTLNVKKHVKHVAPVPAPLPPPVVVLPPAPVITWQENPNHCTDVQYIAADPPFNCINKPAPPPPPVVPVYVAPAPVPASVVSGCGDNFYANYIYMHESGCRTDAIGPNGPCGLGQALPCSKMGCSLYDYACQNAFFTSYALQRYGSWAAAYDYWIANHNW